MRGDGYVLDEFTTLVNPQLSRINNSHVHGITTAVIEDAPTFGEIAGDLLAVLSDAIIVGHNLEFEEKFLAAELTRLGLRPTGVPGLCTPVTARSQLDLWGYRLPDVALRLTGERPSAQHSAPGDARACAPVLTELISNAPHPLRRPCAQPPSHSAAERTCRGTRGRPAPREPGLTGLPGRATSADEPAAGASPRSRSTKLCWVMSSRTARSLARRPSSWPCSRLEPG